MENETTHRQASRKLRHALKQVGDKEAAEDDVPEVYVGDYCEIRSGLDMGPSQPRWLYIFKGGEPVAKVAITKKIMKRFRTEMNLWNDLQSGMMSAHRHLHGGGVDTRKN